MLANRSRTTPIGPQWAYEIKHDGFRLICHRDGERVRVFSRTGHEWGAQLPAIAAALRALPVRSVILDGEGVICGPDGVSDFDRMRAVFGRKGSPDLFLYAFDVLEMDGHDLRAESWDTRRALLTQLLDRCQDGLRLSEHVEDTDVFRQACVMGLEGIVAQRRDSRYRSGRCREWIKVKNRAHPGCPVACSGAPDAGSASKGAVVGVEVWGAKYLFVAALVTRPANREHRTREDQWLPRPLRCRL
jgi:ATP-dependent DNA ligase